MKKLFPLLSLLVLISLACSTVSLPGIAVPTQNIPVAGVTLNPFTPTPPADSAADQPPPIPTETPTLPPTPAPTIPPETRIEDGDRALFIGDYDSALAAYEKASFSPDPDLRASAQVGLGRAYFLRGDTDIALQIFRQTVDEFSQTRQGVKAYFFLAQTYEKIGRPQDAADAYLNYLVGQPGILDAYVYEKRGDLFTSIGSFSQALGEYQAALNSPRLVEGFDLEIKLARAYAYIGDYSTALVMYDDIANRSTVDYIKAQMIYLKGAAYSGMGDTASAQQAYLQAINDYPAAYDAYLSLVELVNAGYPVDDLQRGIVDYFAGEYGAALAALERYLAGTPADPARAYYYTGLCLRAQDSIIQAVDAWDRVIQNYPDSPMLDRASEQKAYTQWAYLDQYAEARQTLVDFVDHSPNHPRAAEFLFDAAQVAERSGDLADAVALWERLPVDYSLSPYVFNALFQAGIGEYRQGNYIAAQPILLRAQANAANTAESSAALFWVAKTYQALGDSASAVKTWQDTAAIDLTGYYSERALDILANRPPFDPPTAFDLGYDAAAERQMAEEWMRMIFNLPQETDLSSPGALAGSPYFRRGVEFWALGLYNLGSAEFDALLGLVQNDPVACFSLAQALVNIGAYRPAILSARQVLTLAALDDASSLNAPMFFSRIRFGVYFDEIIIPEAQSYGFHPFVVWSLMRQESFFDRAIVSSAGARGLMQIMPATGQDIAARLNWPANYSEDSLDLPLVSIKMGLSYLDSTRRYLDDDLFAAMAAYNGGPGNAAIWKSLANNDPDLFLEVVRFDEPRRYIKGIYEMFNIYRRLYGRIP